MMLLKPSLEAFVAVAESRTLSAAALKLGLTQTGMTQRIKSLEAELSVTLFLRSRKGMALTAEGKALYRHCLDVKELEGRLMASLKRSGEESEIDFVITCPSSLVGGRIAKACRPVFERWPKLNGNYLIESNANRLDQLKRGTADVAVVLRHEVTNELDSKILKPFEFILVGPAAWKNRRLKDILATERMYSYRTNDSTGLEYLKQNNLLGNLKRPRLFVSDNQAYLSLLREGLGFGVLPHELADPLLASGDLISLHRAGKPLLVELALAWYPRKTLPDYFKEIVRSIR